MRARASSQPKPSRSGTPGRMLVTSTSARAIRSLITSRASGRRQVEAHRALVAVGLEVVAAAAGVARDALVVAPVVAGRALHLHDLGPQVAQVHRRERAGQVVRHVEHPEARERGPAHGPMVSSGGPAGIEGSGAMGLMGRFTTIVKAKANKALDRAEDPRETLDYSYEKQLEMVQNVRRGVADVATSKKRLEIQAAKLEQSVEKLDGQARQALAQGREDLARVALERKKARPAPAPVDRRAAGPAPDRAGQARAGRAAADGQGRGLPHAQGDDQGPVHRGRGPDQDRRGRAPGSPRTWPTSAWRSSGPRTRPRPCAPAPAPSTSCSSRARSPTSPTTATPSTGSSSRSRPSGDVDSELAKMKAELGAGAPPPDQIGSGGAGGEGEQKS